MPVEKRLRDVSRRYSAFLDGLPEPLKGLAATLPQKLSLGCDNPVQHYGAKEFYPLLRFPLWLEEKYIKEKKLTGREGYGLDAASASLYGYLYIRIQDNVLDEPELFDHAFLLLGNEFIREFFEIYHRLFPPGSAFWEYFRRYWLATTNNTLWERVECGGKVREFTKEDIMKVGGKLDGAKISMAAVCMLAGMDEDIPRYSGVFDRLNIASQFHNDAVSFIKDLKHDYFTGIIVDTLGGGEVSVDSSDVFSRASIMALTGTRIEDWLGMAGQYNTDALSIAGKGLPRLETYVLAKNAHLKELRGDISNLKKELLSL